MNENVVSLDVYRATQEIVPISEVTEYQQLVAANLAADDVEFDGVGVTPVSEDNIEAIVIPISRTSHSAK